MASKSRSQAKTEVETPLNEHLQGAQVQTPTEVVSTKSEHHTRVENKMSEASIIEFSEDLSNAEAPAPLPEQDYPFEIRAAEKKQSNKGNDYLALTLFIAPESYPVDFTDGDPDGSSLSYNRVQLEDNQRNRYRLRKFLEAVGAPLSSKIDLNGLVGLTGTVTVKHEEYEGETRAVAAKISAS